VDYESYYAVVVPVTWSVQKFAFHSASH